MTDPKDPLLEWNRLNISNAETAVAKALFEGTLTASEPLDRFGTWLLAGIAAIAALFVTNISSILPYLSEMGFRRCEGLLIAAGLAGLLAKQLALQVRIHIELQAALTRLVPPILDKHEKDEDQIEEYAKQQGLSLVTDVDMNRAVEPYIAAFPFFLRGFLYKKLREGVMDPYASQRTALRQLLRQGVFTTIESLLFVAFIVVAVAHASAI